MLIALKILGINKFYWLPKFHSRKDKTLWFFEIKFVCCQFMIYSKEMGEEIVKHMKTYPWLNKNDTSWATIDTVPIGVPVLLSYDNGFMFVDTAVLKHQDKISFQIDGYDPAIRYWMSLPLQQKSQEKPV